MADVCARCGSVVPLVDGQAAPFCAVCGLPQLRVSADAVAPAAEPGSSAPPQEKHTYAGVVDWHRALPVALLSAALTAAVAAALPGAIAMGSATGVAPALAPLAALLAVHLYGRRHRNFSARAGGRIGAVTGLLLAFLVTAVTGVAGFVLRYGRHSRELEQTLAHSFEMAAAQLHLASTAQPEVANLLASPELRASSYIVGHLVLTALILMLAGAFGAFAGALRQLRRRRMQR